MLEYVAGTGIVAAAGALIGVGRHSQTLDQHSEILKDIVKRDEFNLLRDRLESMHEDIREIRRRMP